MLSMRPPELLGHSKRFVANAIESLMPKDAPQTIFLAEPLTADQEDAVIKDWFLGGQPPPQDLVEGQFITINAPPARVIKPASVERALPADQR
jgi:hypothetical protein